MKCPHQFFFFLFSFGGELSASTALIVLEETDLYALSGTYSSLASVCETLSIS